MARAADPAGRPVRLRPGDLVRLLIGWLVAALALALAAGVLPGLSASSFDACLLATLVAGLVGLLFRPVLLWKEVRWSFRPWL